MGNKNNLSQFNQIRVFLKKQKNGSYSRSCSLNGQQRPIEVMDFSIVATGLKRSSLDATVLNGLADEFSKQLRNKGLDEVIRISSSKRKGVNTTISVSFDDNAKRFLNEFVGNQINLDEMLENVL